MYRPTQAIIDLESVRSNFRALKKLVGNGFHCPMVKANAYGHGDVIVTKALVEAGAERVGVALIEEGLHLREGGVECEILAFGRLTKESAKAAVESGLTPVLSTWADFEILSELPAPPAFHIKINTGMNRMGFSYDDVAKLRDFFKAKTKLNCIGVCSHLSHGDDAADPNGLSEKQIQKYRQAYELLGHPEWAHHMLNSEALLMRSKVKDDCEWLGARPGLAIYGLCDSPLLKPVMSLQTKLDMVRRVSKGESISYYGRWTASKDSWVAVVPLGYGDGYWRSFTNRAHMLFRGQRVPVVGTVCMDYSLLDLTAACSEGEPKLGEDVVVFGQQGKSSMSVIELTNLVDTIPYELVTNLNVRVPRVFR
jgi:alanine racemase